MQDDLFARAYFDASTGPAQPRAVRSRDRRTDRRARAGEAFAVVVVEIDKLHRDRRLPRRRGQRGARRPGSASGSPASGREIWSRASARTNSASFIAEPGGSAAMPAPPASAGRPRASEPYLVDGVEIFAGACAGVCFLARRRRDAEGLRRKAKAAAREARRERRRRAAVRGGDRDGASARARARRTRCGWRSATAASAAPSSPRSISAPATSIRWKC